MFVYGFRNGVFGEGNGLVQRDVYSSFLTLQGVDTVDVNGVITEAHDREAVWKRF